MADRRRLRDGSGRVRSAFVIGLVAGAASLLVLQRLYPPEEDADIAHYREVRDFVAENFVRDVDPDELVKVALKEMVSSLDDYSRYYDQQESVRVERETSGRFTGIGVVFRRPLDLKQVLFPVPGSPAAAAGVRVGDQLVGIDGEGTEEWDSAGIRDALRGEEGTSVALRVRGLDGLERELEVQRRSIVDPNIRHVGIVDEEHNIGYMALLGFSNQTPREFDRAFALLEQEGMRGLILDLRGNPGGVLGAAVEISGRFISSGVIVSTEGRGEPTYYRATEGGAHHDGYPLVVLVDGDSASASEVLAGALQDHRAAVLVGEATHGKGLVQTIRRYPGERVIAKVTTSYYYTPSHRSLERAPEQGRDFGIVPDLEISIDEEARALLGRWMTSYSPPLELMPEVRAWELSEGSTLVERHPDDPQFEAALELLRGTRRLERGGSSG